MSLSGGQGSRKTWYGKMLLVNFGSQMETNLVRGINVLPRQFE